MTNDPVLSRLGLARKAGKLTVGFAASKEACVSGKAQLVVVASDISDKSFKEIKYFSGGEIPVSRVTHTILEISHSVGIKCGIVAVCDDGFAKAIMQALTTANAI